MKIATFNINNINRRLPNLLRWLKQAKPDIVCLQELKSADKDFPIQAINKAGYGAVWRRWRWTRERPAVKCPASTSLFCWPAPDIAAT